MSDEQASETFGLSVSLRQEQLLQAVEKDQQTTDKHHHTPLNGHGNGSISNRSTFVCPDHRATCDKNTEDIL
jgi:hypothetical protein